MGIDNISYFIYKGVPSSKTKYDIISDREPVPWGKNVKK